MGIIDHNLMFNIPLHPNGIQHIINHLRARTINAKDGQDIFLELLYHMYPEEQYEFIYRVKDMIDSFEGRDFMFDAYGNPWVDPRLRSSSNCSSTSSSVISKKEPDFLNKEEMEI